MHRGRSRNTLLRVLVKTLGNKIHELPVWCIVIYNELHSKYIRPHKLNTNSGRITELQTLQLNTEFYTILKSW